MGTTSLIARQIIGRDIKTRLYRNRNGSSQVCSRLQPLLKTRINFDRFQEFSQLRF